MKLLKKEVFDINKVTVVGSPSITSDGVASGFQNNTSYLRTPIKTTDLLNKSWKIKTCFKPLESAVNSITLWKLSNPNSAYGPDGWSSVTYNPNNKNIIFWYKTGDDLESSEQLYKAIYIGANLSENLSITYEFNINSGEYIFKVYKENGTLLKQVQYSATTTNKQLYYINKESDFIITIGTAYSGTNSVEGSIDLTQFSITVDGQEIYNCLKHTYLMERRKPLVWDKEQFEVVGNPVISDSGVASGFSASNYVTKENVIISNNNWEFILRFTTNDASKNQGILSFSSGYTVGAIINPDGNSFYVSLGQGSSFNIGEFGFAVSKNKTYTIKIGYDGQKYFISELVNNEFVLRASKVSTLLIPTNLGTLRLGLHRGGGSFLNGSIDLKQFKIYTDNNLVFDGGAETYVYDPSKFTVVGSPTITEGGVVSEFNSENYIHTKLIGNLSSGYFKIILSNLVLKTTVASIPIFQIRGQELFTVKNSINIAENYNSYKVFVYDGSSTLLQDLKTDNVSTNLTPKEIIFEAQGETAKLTVNYDSGNPLVINNIDMSGFNYSALQTAYCSLGKTNWVHSEYIEKLNLTDFSVETNNKEVFTGAKEEYYMFK